MSTIFPFWQFSWTELISFQYLACLRTTNSNWTELLQMQNRQAEKHLRIKTLFGKKTHWKQWKERTLFIFLIREQCTMTRRWELGKDFERGELGFLGTPYRSAWTVSALGSENRRFAEANSFSMPNYVFGLRKRMRLIPEQYYRIFFTLTLVLKRRKVAGGFYKKKRTWECQIEKNVRLSRHYGISHT